MVRRPPSADAVHAERLVRHSLAKPVARRRDFEPLFRRLQPVSTGAQVRPGSPPCLAHRTRFDSEAAADALRSQRRIVKGRFQGGGVGYVHADDLALYANAFRRPMARRSDVQGKVYDALCFGGPLTPALLKDETGLLKKQINPALQRLQEAFLIYEDQVDEDWERAWYEFASEWPEIVLDDERRDSDAAEVLTRFLSAFVFANDEQLLDWSQWPARRVAGLVSALECDGRAVATEVSGLGLGWMASSAAQLPDVSPAAGIFLLNRGDFLSRTHRSELERRFGRRDILRFLYSRGEFVGAVRGHWGFKPFDVDDVDVELPTKELAAVREEVLALVRVAYPEPRHRVLRYAGMRIA